MVVLFICRSFLIPPKTSIAFVTEHIPALRLFLHRFFLLGNRFLYLGSLKHMPPATGTSLPISFWISFRYGTSSTSQKEKAIPLRPARPVRPDTVYICLRHIRQIIVDDMRKMIDINAAGGNIGRDQNTKRMIFKTG